MSKNNTKGCEHIHSPVECLNVKIDPNDPKSQECMYFMNQFFEEQSKACHHDSCSVQEHEKDKKDN